MSSIRVEIVFEPAPLPILLLPLTSLEPYFVSAICYVFPPAMVCLPLVSLGLYFVDSLRIAKVVPIKPGLDRRSG